MQALASCFVQKRNRNPRAHFSVTFLLLLLLLLSLGPQLDVLNEGQGGFCSLKLLLTISLSSQLIYGPPPPPLVHTSNAPPKPSLLFLCAHALLLSISPPLLSLAGGQDASSTLQWRQIRPSRPCRRKTSPRKVATSSPLQLICRHSEPEPPPPPAPPPLKLAWLGWFCQAVPTCGPAT